MDTLLVKIFATALTLSQVTTAPNAVKTHFDPATDQPQVVQLLRNGCAHMRKAFDIEDINVDDLIATAMDDPQALTSDVPVFKGINFRDLFAAYKEFCKNETPAQSPFDLAAVIEYYNRAVADLPDEAELKKLRLPGATEVLDRSGKPYAEMFARDQRRIFVPLNEIPLQLQKAFISAEDQRFYQHRGIDERGIVRAFIGNLAQSGRPQGGSTITQQVVKNLIVGEDLTYERKMREMIVASRLEAALTKADILELYLNSTYLGRGSWGVETAARSYFGKSVKDLSLGESALLAGLTKGPSYFNPDRHPQRAQEREAYVLSRMEEDGAISADERKEASAGLPKLVAFERPRRDSGYQYVDQVAREAKAVAGIESLTADSYTVHTTVNPQLQRDTEAALQEGLARFEIDHGRAQFHGPEANLADAIRRIQGAPASAGAKPAWQQALLAARLPLYDVHWPTAVVVDSGAGKSGSLKVGLADGRVLPLSARGSIGRSLKLYDVVFVKVTESRAGKGKTTARADIRVRPQVQGATVVLENKTGRILAMSGGFSYPLSQLNRVTQSARQPGSALKPLTYLAALQKGLQPNTLVRDEEITLPPIGGETASTRERDYWSPKNYDGGASGVTTLRRALEHSKNLATVNLLDGGIDMTPALSLDRICALALEAQIYHECVRYYPFVLGAQPVRPIDLAAFYAAIANEGARPTPYVIESIERQGAAVYKHAPQLDRIGSADRVSFYQLKSMLQGVLRRGTARAYARLAPYAAGKTGTTDSENDAWFVGFTNDVTIAVWVGYDNAEGKRRTLGGGQTGASVALPIFDSVLQVVWADQAPKSLLSGPSPEARKDLVAVRSDDASGDEQEGGRGGALVEYLRRSSNGQPADTRYRLVSREDAYDRREYERYDDDSRDDRYERWSPWSPPSQQWVRPLPWGWQQQRPQQPYQQPQPSQRPQQPRGGLFGWQQQWQNDNQPDQQRSNRDDQRYQPYGRDDQRYQPRFFNR
jgi:1A family penicillin-binding protein